MCQSELRTTVTSAALWSIPVLVVTAAGLAGGILWLNHAGVSGGVRAAAIGGLASLAASIPMRVVARGIVFRPWKA